MVPKYRENTTITVSAAARQRRRREKLKREDLYEEYKAKNANYSKQYRKKQTSAFVILNVEDKAKSIQKRREIGYCRETEELCKSSRGNNSIKSSSKS